MGTSGVLGTSQTISRSQRASMYVGVALVAAATIVFEISLTRVFSQAQFYHFAFMAVSLALLGFGASGSLLALFPRARQGGWAPTLPWLAISCGLGMPLSYLVGNLLPLDVYAIAWDASQVFFLMAYFLLLAVPFVFSGLIVAILLASVEAGANRVYGANLLGSAVGCVAAIGILALTGGPRAIVSAGIAACLGGLIFASTTENLDDSSWLQQHGARIAGLCCCAMLLVLIVEGPSWLDVRLSQYKGLSQALRFPNAHVTGTTRNSYSRVDVVESDGVRQLPGLSYTYAGDIPRQAGISLDGGELWPVLSIEDSDPDMAFSDHMPTSLAYRLRPGSEALLLQPRGGLDLWVALSNGAHAVTVVEDNPLVIEAARSAVGPSNVDPFSDPSVAVVSETIRHYLERSAAQYDIVHLSLAQSYRPITSAVYSLSEDYVHTAEAFRGMVEHLRPNGILQVTRWLQTPPSESVRTLGLLLSALETAGVGDLQKHVVAYRGVQTITFLAKPEPFSDLEMQQIRSFCSELRYDLVIGPGVGGKETNQHNVLREDLYAQSLGNLIGQMDRNAFYEEYGFGVAPPTDSRPFFGHFFKWKQIPLVLRELGKSWQPFGGSGVLMIVALLLMVSMASALFIVMPLVAARWRIRAGGGTARSAGRTSKSTSQLRSSVRHSGGRFGFAYFWLIGLGFMLVEIPLIQRLTVLLERPTYAMTTVLFTLLLFSGVGSILARRVTLEPAMSLLVILIALVTLLLPSLIESALATGFTTRIVLVVVLLAPVGFLLGIPMPAGIAWLQRVDAQAIPWAWAVNGCASVVGSVSSALLALSWGLPAVLGLSALCYAAACLTARLGSLGGPAGTGRGLKPWGQQGAPDQSVGGSRSSGTKRTPPRL